MKLDKKIYHIFFLVLLHICVRPNLLLSQERHYSSESSLEWEEHKRQKTIEQALREFEAQHLASRKEKELPSFPEFEQKPSFVPKSSRLTESWLESKKQYFFLEGDYQASFGIDSGDFLWKRADSDLSEKNWRILSGDGLNRWQNTFDPAIYSRMRIKTGYNPDEGIGFHTFIDISPWSFIGKSNKVTITSENADTADIQLKYWSNTGYTVGEIVYSNLYGDSFALGGRKVKNNKIAPFSIDGINWEGIWANTFDVPELKIKREFWPLRELWFDFKSDSATLRVFPAALQNQAYTSDDPLRLTNRHIWWAPSPWLSQWKPGQLITPEPPHSELFYKGWWDESLSFRTRDSDLERINNLRGFFLNIDFDDALLDFTVASPKNLWQDYDAFDTLNSALRLKYFQDDNMILGFTHASKHGFDQGLDAMNHVFGFDASYGLTDYTSASFQVATSFSDYDKSSAYESKKQGNTYHFNIKHSSHDVLARELYATRPRQEGDPLYRVQLSLTRMDKGFDAALADYHHTRDGEFWSRHLSFRPKFSYQYFGLYDPGISAEDQLYPFRIGDGIDAGRNVISLRWEAENIINQNVDALFDIRDVRSTDGNFIENVSRLEGTYRLTPRLRLKGMGLYHHLPKTQEDIDPFMRTNHARQDSYLRNYHIEAGQDPSLTTFSAGIEYDFFQWMTAHFIWERSNDTTLAYGNFPRGVFNDLGYITTYTQKGKDYRNQVFELYHTDLFPTPPYPYYNIFKTGLFLDPLDNLEIYLSYTRNQYNWAQMIDDNMNHIGLEAAYIIDNKIGLYLRYVHSRANNIRELIENERVVKTSHHSVFSEIKYRMDKESELVAQYGVGGYGDISTTGTYTPYGGGLAVLDTQHIIRFYYRRQF